MVVFTEYNVYCGTEQPQEKIITPCTRTVNEGIYSRTVVNDDATVSTHWWITVSTNYVDDEILAQLVQVQAEHDELIAELLEDDADNHALLSEKPFTAKGKLYARLIHTGKRRYPTDIPPELVQETYLAYTEYYRYLPSLVPPNPVSEET